MTTVTFKGNKVHLSGKLPQKGDAAPSFTLVGQDLSSMTLDSFKNKKKLLNIFISLDTPVCSTTLHKLYKMTSSIPDVVILNISLDLPFAASRFCKAEGMSHVTTLSAFRSSFPEDYGVKIKEGLLQGLCARAVLTLDENNKVLHSQLVPEITDEPDYKTAIASFS